MIMSKEEHDRRHKEDRKRAKAKPKAKKKKVKVKIIYYVRLNVSGWKWVVWPNMIVLSRLYEEYSTARTAARRFWAQFGVEVEVVE